MHLKSLFFLSCFLTTQPLHAQDFWLLQPGGLPYIDAELVLAQPSDPFWYRSLKGNPQTIQQIQSTSTAKTASLAADSSMAWELPFAGDRIEQFWRLDSSGVCLAYSLYPLHRFAMRTYLEDEKPLPFAIEEKLLYSTHRGRQQIYSVISSLESIFLITGLYHPPSTLIKHVQTNAKGLPQRIRWYYIPRLLDVSLFQKKGKDGWYYPRKGKPHPPAIAWDRLPILPHSPIGFESDSLKPAQRFPLEYGYAYWIGGGMEWVYVLQEKGAQIQRIRFFNADYQITRSVKSPVATADLLHFSLPNHSPFFYYNTTNYFYNADRAVESEQHQMPLQSCLPLKSSDPCRWIGDGIPFLQRTHRSYQYSKPDTNGNWLRRDTDDRFYDQTERVIRYWREGN